MLDKTTLAIIGAGPAGCATANAFVAALTKTTIASERNIRIDLFDASSQTNTSIGESIPPIVTQAMHELGVAESLIESHHLPCPGSISIWGSNTPGYNDFYHFPTGQGYHLDRDLFNKQLVASIDKSETVLHRDYTLATVNDIGNGYELTFRYDNKNQYRICADYVVDASGIGSVFSRRIGVAKNVLDQLISLCVIVEKVPSDLIEHHSLIEAVADGWWYAALLPNDKLIVSFCSDQSIIKSSGYQEIHNWKQALSMTQLLSNKIPSRLIPQDATIIKRVAPTSILSRVVGRHWLAVGDAASSYDSISGAGITKALQHGICAGKAVFNALEGDSVEPFAAYQNTVFNDFNQFAQLRHDIYQSEERFKQNLFWLNRIKYQYHDL